MLLPHGYEGQGPDHFISEAREISSVVRPEQHGPLHSLQLQLATFICFRRQAYTVPRRPLCRVRSEIHVCALKAASSSVEDFTEGQTSGPLINDQQNLDPAKSYQVTILLRQGLLGSFLAESQKNAEPVDTAIVRLEQLYPTPVEEMKAAISQFPEAELRFVQDEPANQGAWTYLGTVSWPKYGVNFKVIARAAIGNLRQTGFRPRDTLAEQADLVNRGI